MIAKSAHKTGRNPIMEHEQDSEQQDFQERPSKSQVKRDMLALQALGKRLVETPVDRLRKLNLDEKLLEAILLAQRTNSREGRRRQVHYVGKLMRDAPAQDIQTQLDAWDKGSAAETAHMHRLERDRDRLMTSDEHLTPWLEQHPFVDIQAFRSLIRAARQEAKKNESLPAEHMPQRKHYRALFQAIKAAYDQRQKQPDPPEAPDSPPDNPNAN